MSKSITPHISSTEEIINYPQIVEAVGDVVALPIVSDFGTITPQIINQRELLNKYAGPNGITRSSNISLKLAYALSSATNLLVCRVCAAGVLPGVAIDLTKGTATKIYGAGDKNYTKAPNTRVSDSGDVSFEGGTEQTNQDGVSFLVYSYSPYKSDLCSVSVAKVPGNDKLGVLNLQAPGFNENYTFSLDLDDEDGYGYSRYIDHINQNQSFFHIVPINNTKTITAVDNTKFGLVEEINSVDLEQLNADGTFKQDKYVISAISKMAIYRRDLKIKILYDGCLVSPKIIESLDKIARKRKTLGVFSCPLEANTFTKIKAFYNSLQGKVNKNETSSSYLYSACPSRYDTALFGHRELLPYTLDYILTIIGNANGNQEFTPTFGKLTGVVTGTGMNVALEHSTDPEELALDDNEAPQTEQLQRLSANPVVYDQATGIAYLVNNLTFQTPNLNQLSEENNRRLFNSIQFDINKKLEDFISKPNNSVTRESVAEMLDNYKTSVLDYLGYGLNKDNEHGGFRYNIVPFNAAKRNELQLTVEVCFQDSIKYIKVLYRNIPIMN